MATIDLNCDLGESFGDYVIGMDAAVIPYITCANIACGYHAGDAVVMQKTVALCKEHGVQIGAHPGFPDLVGFGRRNMNITPTEAKAYIIHQVGALKAFCDVAGVKLHHVKPHGALYNMAGKDIALARAICEGIYAIDSTLPILALSGSKMLEAAAEIGLPSVSEVFADRGYQADGNLVPRGQEGAMIEDEEVAIARVVRMAKEGKVTAVDGTEVPLKADSVCVHGDGAKALAFVQRIREMLLAEGVAVEAF